MRRLSATLCLLLLLLTLCGRTLFFELRLSEVRAEMQTLIAAGIADPQAETLVFTDNEAAGLNWLDEGKELEWKGERYDVLSQQKSGGQVVLHVLSDKAETALVGGFRKEQHNTSAPLSFQLLKLAALSYLPPVHYLQGVTHTELIIEHHGRCRQLLPQTYPEHPGRPPREIVFLS